MRMRNKEGEVTMKRFSLVLILIIVLMLVWGIVSYAEEKKVEILAFCGSASKPAMEECAKLFEEKSGIRVVLYFSGSGEMLSQMKMSKRGDIYIPGSPDYMVKAVNDGVVDVNQNVEIIAYLVPAILVQKGNPKNIQGLYDLSKEGIRVAIGNPESVCVGLYAYEILERGGLLNKVSKNIVTLGGSCSMTAALIPMKAVDAIMGWEVFAKWNSETTVVIFLKPDQVPRLAYIPAAISTFSEHPKEAKQFIEFLKCLEGQQIFTKWGYLSTEKEARKFAPGASIGGEYKLPADYVSPVGK